MPESWNTRAGARCSRKWWGQSGPAGKTPAEGAKADPDEEGEPEKESDQAVDVHLREAERILLDLIELSGGGAQKGVATSIAR
jgi:hypothetical protein